ncbi:hypothetical protein LINPERPRIM_LOCUS36650 [Linum perenne]
MDRSSHEYHSYISAMMRAPSIMYGVPQYPNVHKAFKHDPNHYHEDQHQEMQQQKKHKIFKLCKWKTFKLS